MRKRKHMPRILNVDEAREVFANVDETGHVNPELSGKEKRRRKKTGIGLNIDPLSGRDPSGSNVGDVIKRTAVWFVVIVLVVLLGAQISYGFIRRINATRLSSEVNVESVAGALKGGVEWGDGFTQFPQVFSIQEANEATGRIEVTVCDTTSQNEVESMAASYIQATAFATNALLNNGINTVVYRVQVHEAQDGKLETAQFFGFLQPTGPTKNFMTFIFTKAASSNGGFNIFCTITGLDEQTTQRLRERMGTTPLISTSSADETKTATVDAEDTAEGAATPH